MFHVRNNGIYQPDPYLNVCRATSEKQPFVKDKMLNQKK